MSRTMSGILALIFGALALLCLILLLAVVARADDAALTWNANTEADLAGYRIYRGLSAATCATAAPLPPLLVNSVPVQVDKVTSFVDTALPAMDGTICYEITAFDTRLPVANESDRSNRVSKVLNSLPPLAPSGLGVVIQ